MAASPGIRPPRPNLSSLYAIYFVSGACGLAYQMVWSRMFAIGLGHELPGVLAVVAAFFGGLALGGWTLDRRVSRSPHPGRWYAGLELLIGGWGLVSVMLIPRANELALKFIGLEVPEFRHWTIAFAVPFVVLLPATVALGATFPAMERLLAPQSKHGKCVGTLYALNTFGAVMGTLLSTLVIAPALGFRATILVFAMLNLLCGLAVLILERRIEKPPVLPRPFGRGEGPRERGRSAASVIGYWLGTEASVGPSPQPSPLPKGRGRSPSVLAGSRVQSAKAFVSAKSLPKASTAITLEPLPRLYATVFLTGLLGIGYEVLGVRVLAQVLENTIYSFAAVLSVYLVGTAMGAALYQRFGRSTALRPLLGNLICGLALSCLGGVWVLSQAQVIYNFSRAALGDGDTAVLLAEMSVAAAVFGLPTMLMGASFGLLTQSARRDDGGVGRAAALNALGGALAPALFGVLLLPALGAKWSLVVVAVSYLVLLPQIKGWQWIGAGLPVGLVFLLPAQLQLVQKPPGGEVLAFREGVMDSVAVVKHFDGNRSLLVNNRFTMGGTGAANAERRHAHLPLLLHPDPKRALFLGLGTGITFGAAHAHPDLQADGVELVPEIIDALHFFEPQNAAPERQPGLKIFVADARRFVRVTDARYDVIVADLFHPARDGAGALYTVEHFRAIRARLNPGGLFCQWLPLFQLDEPMLRVVLRTMLEVFPDTHAYLLRYNVDTPVLGLIGNLEPTQYPAGWFEQRVRDAGLREQLQPLPLVNDFQLFGGLLAGPPALREFSKAAPLNTDDHPVVIFGAPKFTYQRKATSYGRLLTLLDLHAADPGELIATPAAQGGSDFVRELKDFISARDVYLRGLVADAEGRKDQAIDAYVASARLSREFSTGYAQCLTLAMQESKSNPRAARTLLQRLVEAQPDRPIARELLKQLPGP